MLFLLTVNFKVKARGSQARGEAKTKTASLVEALYGFDSGRSKKAIAENRKKAEELKSDKGFVFKVGFFHIVFYLSVLIYSVRYFWIRTANEKEFTITLLYKRPLTQCGSKINATKELYMLIFLSLFQFTRLP